MASGYCSASFHFNQEGPLHHFFQGRSSGNKLSAFAYLGMFWFPPYGSRTLLLVIEFLVEFFFFFQHLENFNLLPSGLQGFWWGISWNSYRGPLYVTSCFSPCFQVCLFPFGFYHFDYNTSWCGSFGVNSIEVQWASVICRFVSSIKFGRSLADICSNVIL